MHTLHRRHAWYHRVSLSNMNHHCVYLGSAVSPKLNVFSRAFQILRNEFIRGTRMSFRLCFVLNDRVNQNSILKLKGKVKWPYLFCGYYWICTCGHNWRKERRKEQLKTESSLLSNFPQDLVFLSCFHATELGKTHFLHQANPINTFWLD